MASEPFAEPDRTFDTRRAEPLVSRSVPVELRRPRLPEMFQSPLRPLLRDGYGKVNSLMARLSGPPAIVHELGTLPLARGAAAAPEAAKVCTWTPSPDGCGTGGRREICRRMKHGQKWPTTAADVRRSAPAAPWFGHTASAVHADPQGINQSASLPRIVPRKQPGLLRGSFAGGRDQGGAGCYRTRTQLHRP